MSQLPVQLCHMWPVLYIITIISLSFVYIVYNIPLTSLLSRILILKAISVPVWDYWHAAYLYVLTCLYIVKVNTFIIIHVHVYVYTYYIEKCNSYMSTFFRYVFMFKLLFFHYMSHIYRKMNTEYYSDIRVHLICSVLRMRAQMYDISCDYNALSQYLILLNHG